MTTEDSKKTSLLFTRGGMIGIIAAFALLSIYIASYVGVGYLTQSIWQTESTEDDERIVLNLDSKNTPAHNKLLLIKI